jgi:predicted DCC family thiol-disulfide oxidoreductase YuxK
VRFAQKARVGLPETTDTIQSPLGQSLALRHGLDPDDPTSWLVLDGAQSFTGLDALVHTGANLGGIWQALKVLTLLPKIVRNTLYNTVARNRYRIFGAADMCHLPDPAVRKRLVQ